MATNDDEWRRKRVEELFGPRLTPGFARDANEAPKLVREDVEPMRRPAPARELPLPPVRPLPPGIASTAGAMPSRRRRQSWWPLLAIVALALAAGAGWLARGFGNIGQSASPAIAPVAVTPVPMQTAESMAPVQAPVIAPAQSSKQLANNRPMVKRSTDEAKSVERQTVEAAPASVKPVTVAKPISAPAKASVTRTETNPGYKPSFNCKRAHADVTQMICNDAGLSALDRRLDKAYRSTISGADARTIRQVQDGQSDFLNRRSECNSAACIADVYRDRLDALAELRNSAVIVPRAVEPQPLPAPRVSHSQRSQLPVCKGYQFYRPMSPCMVMPRHRTPADAR